MNQAIRYPCNGGETTVSEVAKGFGLTPEAVRQRLKKCNRDMQAVYDSLTEEKKPSKEEAAISEIMSALGIEEEAAIEEEPAAAQPEAEAAQAEAETPEGAAELPMDAAPRMALRRLNTAIDALSGLYESDVGALSRDLSRFIGELRAFRARTYEKYVDWHAVAQDWKGAGKCSITHG